MALLWLRAGLRLQRNIPYRAGAGQAQCLDVLAPTGRHLPAAAPLPAVVYIHGGGFNILSKESHFLLALQFVRRGYTVFNINYRLAPAHPFPAGLEDVCSAYLWVVQHAEEYGADAQRIIVAGESAGANLLCSLVLAACTPRPESFASALQAAPVPFAALPTCGILQVSDPGRLRRRKPHLPRFYDTRVRLVARYYLGEPAMTAALADPVVVFEQQPALLRALPPFFMGVGTRDPLLDDSRRLDGALRRLGARSVVKYYPGALHAFHAWLWGQQAKLFWRDTWTFLDALKA